MYCTINLGTPMINVYRDYFDSVSCASQNVSIIVAYVVLGLRTSQFALTMTSVHQNYCDALQMCQ